MISKELWGLVLTDREAQNKKTYLGPFSLYECDKQMSRFESNPRFRNQAFQWKFFDEMRG